MEIKNKSYECDLLQKIVNHLIVQSTSMCNLGLFYGKMGSVLFFFHYARYVEDESYEDFAEKLLEHIYEDIHVDVSTNFSNGLCGIGWGIEYLVQQGFVAGETDDILSEIDCRVMRSSPRYITDYSLEKGLEGIAWYVLSRLLSPRMSGRPFDTYYLYELQQACLAIKTKNRTVGISLLVDYMNEKEIMYPFIKLLNNVINLLNQNKENNNLSWQVGLRMIL